MDLKERTSEVLKEGSGRSVRQVTGWVKEPGNVKESGGRLLWLAAAFGLWLTCLTQHPWATLLVTPVGLVVVFAWFGLRGEPGPARRDDPKPPREEFWDMHTPRDDQEMATDTVPLRPRLGKEPVEDTNVQVNDLRDSETVSETAHGGQGVTGNDRHDDLVRIFPVASTPVSGQSESSLSQVRKVSPDRDSDHGQATSIVTESEVDEGDISESFVDTIMEMDDAGHSVRKIADATGKSRSTVHRTLRKARAERNADQLAQLATQGHGQVVLPGAWYGEDAHAQEVRFTDDAVVDSSVDEAECVSVLSFIQEAFLGKAETTTENWQISLAGGVISGLIPNRQIPFQGYWSETGTVVICRVVIP